MPSFAIVVGINEYRPQTGQDPLAGAVDDACDFADWALDPSGGDVAPGNLYFWTHPWPPAEPLLPPQQWSHSWPQPPSGRLQEYLKTAPQWAGDQGPQVPDRSRAPNAREIVATVLERGQNLAGMALAGVGDVNRIYVFLAGHGVRTHEFGALNSQTCFLAGDFHSVGGIAFGLIPCESFRKNLLIGGFQEVFLFLDCCRVQDPVLPIPASVICGGANEPPTSPWGVGNAAAEGGRAFEVAGPPARGAFSMALLEGLRTHRDHGSNALPVETLETFVVRRIQTRSLGQVPTFPYNPPAKPGPVIVTGGVVAPPSNPPLTLDLSNIPAGTHVRLLSNGLAEVPGFENFVAGAVLVVVPDLAPGLYQIERLDGGAELLPFRHPRAEPIRVG